MQATLLAFAMVGAGGALGAIARYGLTMATLSVSATLPVGTLTSNLLGCLLMGGLAEYLSTFVGLTDTELLTHHHRLLFGVGFCGAFTTLSSMVLELATLMQRDQVLAAFAYLLVTLIGGFALFYSGAALARTL